MAVLLINCPWCGERPELEFTYAGEAHRTRPKDPAALDDEEWAEYLYARRNRAGVHAERWRHSHGCARFFNALRDTINDRFLATYKIGEKQPAPLHQGVQAVATEPDRVAQKRPA